MGSGFWHSGPVPFQPPRAGRRGGSMAGVGGYSEGSMKWSFSIGRVSGIDIRVHASFGLILVLGAVQWGVPHGAMGALFGVLLMICLFACVVLHELAHSLVAQAFGCKVHGIGERQGTAAAVFRRAENHPRRADLRGVAGDEIQMIR